MRPKPELNKALLALLKHYSPHEIKQAVDRVRSPENKPAETVVSMTDNGEVQWLDDWITVKR